MTCPNCNKSYKLEMPTTYCFIRFKCPKCKKTLTPKNDDCCVFCSYADKKCPPKQEEIMKRKKFPPFL